MFDSGGGSACVGEAGSIWDISVPFSQFCCEPKTTLKIEERKEKTNYYRFVTLGYELFYNFYFSKSRVRFILFANIVTCLPKRIVGKC